MIAKLFNTTLDKSAKVIRFMDSFVRTSDCTASWAKCGDADNKKINANFLFGGFIASYESLCVHEQFCFVSTVVRKLPQIKNFVYPLCVTCKLKNAVLTLN